MHTHRPIAALLPLLITAVLASCGQPSDLSLPDGEAEPHEEGLPEAPFTEDDAEVFDEGAYEDGATNGYELGELGRGLLHVAQRLQLADVFGVRNH